MNWKDSIKEKLESVSEATGKNVARNLMNASDAKNALGAIILTIKSLEPKVKKAKEIANDPKIDKMADDLTGKLKSLFKDFIKFKQALDNI